MHHQETSLSIGGQQVVGAVLKWQRKEKAKTFEKALTFFLQSQVCGYNTW